MSEEEIHPEVFDLRNLSPDALNKLVLGCTLSVAGVPNES